MPQSQQTQQIRQPQQRSGGGGLLRSILRPFMPEVSAGIDMADALINGGDAGGAATQLVGMLSKGEEEEEPPPGVEVEKVPDFTDNPDKHVLAMSTSGQGGGGFPYEESDPDEGEPDEDEDDLTPEQMTALQQIEKMAPGLDKELQDDPGLLDGAESLVQKLRRYYRQQSQERMA